MQQARSVSDKSSPLEIVAVKNKICSQLIHKAVLFMTHLYQQ